MNVCGLLVGAGLCCSRDNGETACGRFCCKRNQDCVNEQCVATAAAVAQPTQPLVVPIFASNRDQPQQLPQPQQQPIIINQPAQPAPQAPVIMPAQQPPVIIPPQMPPVIVPPNPPPVDTIPCGTVTCSPGQQCANAGTGELERGLYRLDATLLLMVFATQATDVRWGVWPNQTGPAVPSSQLFVSCNLKTWTLPSTELRLPPACVCLCSTQACAALLSLRWRAAPTVAGEPPKSATNSH